MVGALNAKALSRVRIPLLRGFFFNLEARRLTGPAAEWPALADWASCVGRLGDVKYLYSEEMNNKVIAQWKIQKVARSSFGISMFFLKKNFI